jgi:type I restriction enzyme R subunit
MRKAFDSDDYQVMLVANKFQTGFDQPKLCAMYVDKNWVGGVRTNLITLKPDLSG